MKIITNKSDLEIVKIARQIRIKNAVLLDLNIQCGCLNHRDDQAERYNVAFEIKQYQEELSKLRNRLNQIINE